jgi:alcohol dehydrogenase
MHSYKKFAFFTPSETWIGFGAAEELGNSLAKKHVSKALIVTDEFMASSKIVAQIKSIVEANGISTSIYSGVTPDPTSRQVSDAAVVFVEEHCNALISVGGGSPHDCAKAVKYLLVQGGVCVRDQVILAAVNTTAGTGSELTRFAIITDLDEKVKIPLVHEVMIPDIAVDDTALMMDMPAKLTAATGMDALTHAVEAFVSINRNYIIGCTCLQAIQLVDKYLREAVRNGSSVEARDGMAYAQYLAGMAFSNAGLGVIHAMAHQIGATYHIPHGVANAVLLPYGISHNAANGCDHYVEICKALNLYRGNLGSAAAGTILAEYFMAMNREMGIPVTLHELGIPNDSFEDMTEKALSDVCIETNPVPLTSKDVLNIFLAAYAGEVRS